MRKIWAEQLGIGEHLTQKQWYWAMGLDDIPESPTWPMETWPRVRPFWHKNNLRAHLDAWAKCDPLLLNKLNPLRDSNASEYWKRHNPILQYSSNPRNIQQKLKRAQASIRLTEPSKPVTPLVNPSICIIFSHFYQFLGKTIWCDIILSLCQQTAKKHVGLNIRSTQAYADSYYYWQTIRNGTKNKAGKSRQSKTEGKRVRILKDKYIS